MPCLRLLLCDRLNAAYVPGSPEPALRYEVLQRQSLIRAIGGFCLPDSCLPAEAGLSAEEGLLTPASPLDLYPDLKPLLLDLAPRFVVNRYPVPLTLQSGSVLHLPGHQDLVVALRQP